MNSLLFDNVLSWSAQVSILVIAAAAAAYALRHPRARLYFWQAILVVALLLPVIAPWNQPVVAARESAGGLDLGSVGAAGRGRSSAAAPGPGRSDSRSLQDRRGRQRSGSDLPSRA